jgi:general secretion pathway protein G
MFRTQRNKGFTLVEILIVVIILGILAAIVIPQFTNASTDARRNSLTSQLQTLRSQLELYKLQHNDRLPTSIASGSTDPNVVWLQMTQRTDVNGDTTGSNYFGPYLQQNPTNPLNAKMLVFMMATGAAEPVFGAATGIPPNSGAGADDGFVVHPDTMKIWGTNQTTSLFFDEVLNVIQ